jgi:hypothetical protein
MDLLEARPGTDGRRYAGVCPHLARMMSAAARIAASATASSIASSPCLALAVEPVVADQVPGDLRAFGADSLEETLAPALQPHSDRAFRGIEPSADLDRHLRSTG